MNEVLEIVLDHCEKARNTSDHRAMGVNLKMASRALRCALELYGERITEEKS
jgi:hypothetical protein